MLLGCVSECAMKSSEWKYVSRNIFTWVHVGFPRRDILEQSALSQRQTGDKKVNLKSSDFEERRRRKIYRSSRSSQQLSQATKKKEEDERIQSSRADSKVFSADIASEDLLCSVD